MPPTWIPSFEKTIEILNRSPLFGAEKRVAESLNKIKASDVWILHSLKYEVMRQSAAPTDLEIDFLVIWKNRGFLILEVKGGRVDFDPIDKQWWLTPKNHPRKKYSRSPVFQVQSQRDDLCGIILPKIFPKKLNIRNIVDRVLVFPDVCLSDFKDQHGQKPSRIDDFDINSIIFPSLNPKNQIRNFAHQTSWFFFYVF